MRRKTLFQRGLSALTALVLTVSLLPAAAAADTDPDGLELHGEYAVTEAPLSIPDTVEIRVRIPAGQNRRQIIMNNYQTGAEDSWGLEVNSDNTLRYWERVNGEQISCKFSEAGSKIDVCTGEWMLLSLVRDKANCEVLAYVNGELKGTLPTGGVPFHDTVLTNPLHFGTDLRMGYWLNGSIGEVRMWSDLRTAEEIADYAEKTVNGGEEGLAHAWQFTQPSEENTEAVFQDLVDGGSAVTTHGYRDAAPEPDPNERNGLRFDAGENEYVQVQGTLDIPATVETWIKLDPGTNARQIIMNNYAGGGDSWGIEVNSDNTLRYWESLSDSSANLYFRDINVCTGQWMLVSVVRDAANQQVQAYVNGELKSTQSASSLKTTAARLTKELCFGGDYHNPPIHMNGSIYEVRMWSDERTADEIKSGYTGTITGGEENLTHLWNFSSAEEGRVYMDTVFPDQAENGVDILAVGYPPDPNKAYTVTFQLSGGSAAEPIPDQSGKIGDKVAAPAVEPTRKNCTFTGWYQDAACTQKWDFDADTIAGPTTIYAGWRFELPDADLKITGGIAFNDASDQLCSAKRLPDVPRTFEATIKLPKSPSPSGGVICGSWMDAGYYDYDLGYVNFEINESGQPRLYWQQERSGQPAGDTQSVVIPGVDLRQDQWIHVAVAFDDEADIVRCYINGELVSAIDNCAFHPVIPAQALKIGGDYRGTGGRTNTAGYNSKYFRGQIANVCIWSTVRSGDDISADVASLASNGSVNTGGGGLLAGWSFQDAQAPIFRDLSGSGNDVADFVDWLYPSFARGDYSMVALPDTQFLSQKYPDSYKKLIQWIVDHEETYSIQAVMHLGDMVNSNTDAQWAACTSAMNQLNRSGIAWMPMRGNHDDSNWFNTNFPFEEYGSNRSWFVDSYEDGKLDQSCWEVSCGGRDYLIFSMGYAPSQGAIAWAEEIIQDNPDKNVILTAHAFMYWDGTHIDPVEDCDSPAWENCGQQIWEQLGAKYPNVVLGLGGHIGYPDLSGRTDKNGAGKEVTSILCDAQGMDDTYNLAMMMLLTFHEDSNEVDVNWYSVCNDRLFRARNQFTITVPHAGEDAPEDHQYEVLVSDGTGSGLYAAGTTVAITAADKGGYTFDHWEIISGDVKLAGAGSRTTTFTMPEGAVSIKAVYVPASSGGSGSSSAVYAVTAASVSNGTVSVSPQNAGKGAAVTITVKPDSGYGLDRLTVTDQKGGSVQVVSQGENKYTFTMPEGRVRVDAVFTRNRIGSGFTDVPGGHWAMEAITWASENGYMNGKTSVSFAPGDQITRQQLWMILARLAGRAPGDMAEARAWAMDSGLTDGTNPTRAVSRQQMVTILCRYAEWKGYDVSGKSSLDGFSDNSFVAGYAADAMGWAVAAGIVGGTGAGTLDPAGTATRAQFAVILMRFSKNW